VDLEALLNDLRAGLVLEDAAALQGVEAEEIENDPEVRKQVRKAEAEFAQRMTRILVDVAEVRQDVKSATFLLKRPKRNRDQMTLRFEGSTVLELPSNGRLRQP
jgi:hypothetical protein